ncbi:EscU/YscU/HrcU family type III secretion system export apparatus switch protein, partial [Salmonella enterica subsp. enterica serovar Montevideo]|nr:EscU/YscU/HrcU family type III secretion system export apparatus switch protein [Salmonella enterica subsp. enterica serovar Montevideo]
MSSNKTEKPTKKRLEDSAKKGQSFMMQAAPLNEALFMALLFSMIRLPDPIRDTHQRAQQLRLEVARL